MTGKPGRSGGPRQGAGRKPYSFRLKLGDKLFMNAIVGEHGTLGNLVEVSEITRTCLVLTIIQSNEGRIGEKINLLR